MSPRGGQVIRGLAAVVGVLAVVVGLPTLIVVLGSNPLDVLQIDWPSREQAWEWFTGTDYGFYKLSALIFVLVQVIFWCGWAWFIVLITREFVVQLRERRGVYWSTEPGAMRRGAVAGLVAAVLLLSSPGTPPTPEAPDVVSTSQLANPPVPVGFVATITPTTLVAAPDEEVADELPRYTVHLGDTLWGLAERYLGDGPRWRQLYSLNQAVIPNPDRLDVGVVLRMPPDAALPPPPADPGPGARRLTVAPGDTLTGIAARELGDPAAASRLWEINQGRTQPDGRAMTDPDRLMPGWRLWIPAHAPGTPAAPAPAVPPQPPSTPSPPCGPADQSQNGRDGQNPTPPGTSAPTPPAPPTTSNPTGTQPPAPAPHTGVDLPGGTWVTLAMAAAVSAAIVAMRRRRWHRHRPTPGLDPAPAPPTLPPAARVLWAAAHRSDGGPGEFDTTGADIPIDGAGATDGEGGPGRPAAPEGRPLWAPPAARPTTVDEPADLLDTTAERPAQGLTPSRGWPPPRPVMTARSATGERSVEMSSCAGLGLAGVGGGAAARAVVVGLLGEDSLHPPVVHLTADAARVLFPTDPQAAVNAPGTLVRHSGVEQAARVVEREVLRRLRLIDEHTSSSPATAEASPGTALDELRARDPGEPLPTILLVTTTPAPESQALLTGLLGLGRRVAVVGVVLGEWANCLTVDIEHHVTATSVGFAHLSGTQLAALTDTEGAQLLDVILAARGGPDILGRFAEETSPPPPPAAGTPDPDTSPTSARPAAVYVRVLGGVGVQANGGEVTTGLERRGWQVLAYLAAHTDPVPADTLDEAIFADAEEPKGLRNTVISRTRGVLAGLAGSTAPIIRRVNGHYQLNPQVVDTDVWRMQRLLAAARAASTDEHRVEQLRGLLELAIGEPFAGTAYDWAEEVAEPLRRQAVSALLLLATLSEAGDPATALGALSTAITLNRYGEELYYKAIEIHVREGNHHSAHQLYQQLEHLLATDIEKEPDKSIHDLIPNTATRAAHSANTPPASPTARPTARPTSTPPSLERNLNGGSQASERPAQSEYRRPLTERD